MEVSVVILTFNSAATIGATLKRAKRVSDDIHVVDSGSDDETRDIAAAAGARVVEHEFVHYGAQRNWAIDNLPLKHAWELHLDADERLTPELAAEINALDEHAAAHVDGYCIPRLVHFMGRPIRHGAMYPVWHLRLFRRGAGRCEMRRYDQHFYVEGAAGSLSHPFIDDIRMPLSEWVVRHNLWSKAEVEQLLAASTEGRLIEGRFDGTPIERQHARRRIYQKMPPLLRPFLLFVYRYFFRLGFLDGREGLIFFVLQTFWFRFLIDAKLYERRVTKEGSG